MDSLPRLCVFFCLFSLTQCRTELISAVNCFQSPESPIRFDSVVLSGEASRGSFKCFLEPIRLDYYLNIRVNKLNLNGKCPEFILSEYSSLIKNEIPESESFPPISYKHPGDSNPLVKANCDNFNSLLNTMVQTSVPGRKVMVEFDPADSDNINSFEITVTPYFLGTSSSCPAEHFRCFNSRDRCIPDSITCDGIDNCFDGSDETNYLCTGRIGNLPLPLFIILVIVGILVLIALITGVVVFFRRRHLRKLNEQPENIQMATLRDGAAVQEPLMPPPPTNQ